MNYSMRDMRKDILQAKRSSMIDLACKLCVTLAFLLLVESRLLSRILPRPRQTMVRVEGGLFSIDIKDEPALSIW